MSSFRRFKSFSFTVGLLALFVLLLAPSVAMAGKPKKPPVVVPIDKRILISAVDISTQEVTFTYERDKSRHVYVVDGMTQVKAQGHEGSTIADIKVGQQVYSYTERDDKALDNIEVAIAESAPVSPNAKGVVKPPAKK